MTTNSLPAGSASLPKNPNRLKSKREIEANERGCILCDFCGGREDGCNECGGEGEVCLWCGESHPVEEARLKCEFCGDAVTCADADNQNAVQCADCWEEAAAEAREEMKLVALEDKADAARDSYEADAFDRAGDR